MTTCVSDTFVIREYHVLRVVEYPSAQALRFVAQTLNPSTRMHNLSELLRLRRRLLRGAIEKTQHTLRSTERVLRAPFTPRITQGNVPLEIVTTDKQMQVTGLCTILKVTSSKVTHMQSSKSSACKSSAYLQTSFPT